MPTLTLCEFCDPAKPATSLIRTRMLGGLARDGHETSIIWDLRDKPARGWSTASPICRPCLLTLIDSLSQVL